MASNMLTKEEQNYIRFVKARDDVMPLPLRDILDWKIKPKDLYQKIISCSALNNGENRLDSNQISLTKQKDYRNFDVTLLYKLIRNLCPGLKPTQGWGIKLNFNDTTIGDDIERIRVVRNKLGHCKSSNIPDSEFTNRWTELKIVIERLQKAMSKNGYNTDYKEKLRAIDKLDFGDDPREKYKTFLVLEYAYDCLQQASDREEPAVSIAGNENAMGGENAVFEAEVTNADPSCWSLTWQKTREHITESININKDKYSGSTDRKIVITSVSKEDEWKYQAVLSRNTNGNNQKILSNEILLQVLGEPPSFAVWKVTTDIDGINIHYEVEDKRPNVFNIKWTRNGKLLDFENKNYAGGSLEDKILRIASPTVADRAKYCCTITNAVGSASMDITLDVPRAKILTDSKTYFGSCTSILSEVVSCPAPDRAQWQKSIDGQTFHCIDISEAKYHGSSLNPESPLLEIKLISFDDKQHYRLCIWNKIGEHVSNTVFLDVIGSPPNVTTSHKTNFEDHSITLIGMVFLYDERPVIETLFWSKNGQKLNSQGMRGKYSEVSINNPSLTIFDVNQHDAGSYQLTATNAVGSTQSEAIVLGTPDVFLEKCEKKEDDSWWFTLKIKSIPSPFFVQWSKKEKNSDSFHKIDANAQEYKGTSNSLPRPVLVIKQCEKLQTNSFQIEAQNFIGSCKKIIQDDTSPENPNKDTQQSHSLSNLYYDEGASVLFANLFDDLAEGFPINKIQRLQDLIRYSSKVRDETSIQQMNCARDCFRILSNENLFTPEDVIYVQYLLKTTHCETLYTRCYEYAKAQRSLCFYEMPTENGFKKVKFHVQGSLEKYTKEQIELIRKTVAALLRCTVEDIFVSGLDHSSSFYVVVSIRPAYFRNIFALEDDGKEKLFELNIDYFVVDFLIVYLNHPKENGLRQVRFHVDRYQRKLFTEQIELIRKAVSGLLRCTVEDIFLNETDHCSQTSYVVVSIKQAYLRNLVGLEDPDKEILIGMNIDYYIAYPLTVYLKPRKALWKSIFEVSNTSMSESKQGSKLTEKESEETLEFDKEIPTEYHMEIFSKNSSKDLQYGDEKTSLTVLQEMNDIYIQPKIPLPTHYIVKRLIEKQLSSGSQKDTPMSGNKQRSELMENEILEERLEFDKRLASKYHMQIFDEGNFKDLQYEDKITRFIDLKKNKDMYKPPKVPLPAGYVVPMLINKEFVTETEVSSSQRFRNTVTLTAKIKLPVGRVNHIFCKSSNILWASTDDGILEIDEIGNILRKLDILKIFSGEHTLTKNGELLFLKANCVYKLALGSDPRILFTLPTKPFCIHSSRIDGNVLIGIHCGVTRYSEKGDMLQEIDLSNKKGAPYCMPCYITENINRDILVSSWSTGKVVAVDYTGRLRFEYKGHDCFNNFTPTGICTDILGHILVGDKDNFSGNIHLLDVDGNFLSYLHTRYFGLGTTALCVDDKHNLYVGSVGKIKVYSYLTDEMLEERSSRYAGSKKE